MARTVDCRQIRAARGLLDWSQRTLAENADVGVLTVKRLERETRAVGEPSYLAVVAALEAAGVVFLAAGAVGPSLGSCVALRTMMTPT